MGQRLFEELRWQVLLPQKGRRWKLYLSAAPRRCCSLHTPISSCLSHALASPSEFPWAWPRKIRHTGVAGSNPSGLPWLHLEPALHELYERQEGRLLSHTPISGREWCRTVVPVPTKPPVTPWVHLQKSTQHISEITCILHPSSWVFSHWNSLLTKATQEMTNRKIY